MMGYIVLIFGYFFTPFASYESTGWGVFLYVSSLISIFAGMFVIFNFFDVGDQNPYSSIADRKQSEPNYDHVVNPDSSFHNFSLFQKTEDKSNQLREIELDRRIYAEEQAYKNYQARQEQLNNFINLDQESGNRYDETSDSYDN